jgi:hypothetical protein
MHNEEAKATMLRIVDDYKKIASRVEKDQSSWRRFREDSIIPKGVEESAKRLGPM